MLLLRIRGTEAGYNLDLKKCQGHQSVALPGYLLYSYYKNLHYPEGRHILALSGLNPWSAF